MALGQSRGLRNVTIAANTGATGGGGGGGGFSGDIANEGFEESNSGGALGSGTDGYDSTLVTGTNGLVDQDFSTSGLSLVGSQCAKVGASTSYAFWETTARTELYVYFQWRVPVFPIAANPYICSISVGGTDQALVRVLGSSTGSAMRIYNGSTSADTVATMSANTTYHVWLHWKTDGSAVGGFTTDGTVPTGNNLATVAGGNGTTSATRVFLENNDGTETHYFDHLIISTTPIPSNP